MAIKEYLKENKISVTKLSKMTNIPRSTVSDVVNGTTDINSCRVIVLKEVAKALNMSMEDFYKLASEK